MQIVPSDDKLHYCEYCHEPTDYNYITVEKYLVTGSYVSPQNKTLYKGVKATVTVPICQKCSNKNDLSEERGVFLGILIGLALMSMFLNEKPGLQGVLVGVLGGVLTYYGYKKLFSAKVKGDFGVLADMHNFGFRDKKSCLRNITPHTQDEIAKFLSDLVEKYDYEIYDNLGSIILDRDNARHILAATAYTVSDMVDNLNLNLDSDLDLDIDNDPDFDFDFDGGDD